MLGDGVVLIDKTCKIIYVNYAAECLFARDSESLINESIEALLPERSQKKIYQQIVGLLNDNSTKVLLDNNLMGLQLDGSEFPTLMSFIPIKIENESTILLLVRDRSEILKLKSIIKEVGEYDPLTNLLNRTTIQKEMDKLIKLATRYNYNFSIMFIDIDNFKAINDLYGHSAGDNVLKNFATRMRELVRDTDLVARLGGDEFILVQQRVNDFKEIALLGERVINAFAQPFYYEKQKIYCALSIGVAVYPSAGSSTEELIEHSDQAMYEAKKKGGNQLCFYSDEMNEALKNQYQIQEALHTAISKKEFTLCYQPQVRMLDNKIIGIEALIRWKGREIGEISPELFIPIAEETGIIHIIDYWVLDSACQQVKPWLKKNPELILSINISLYNLRLDLLVEVIENLLTKHTISPQQICIELSEAAVMSNADITFEQVKKLKKLGLKLSIDDFGTGYSSMLYLIQLPFDELKLDKSLIDKIVNCSNTKNVIKTIILLAKLLQLEVIAEGVEEQEQATCLQMLGCDCAQGYHYYKPMTAKEISTLLLA